MASSSEVLASAWNYHQTGRLYDAERLCRQVLEEEPEHPDACHLLGVIAYQMGRADLAIHYIDKAIARRPDEANFHCNLGLAFQALGKVNEAETTFRRAIQINPLFAEAHFNLGISLAALGKLEETVAAYQQALDLKPDYGQAHYNLGNILRNQGKWDPAAASYRRAIQCLPSLAEAYNNLGSVLSRQGKWNEAVRHYEEALRLKPDLAEAHNNLGVARVALRQLEEAVTSHRQAACLNPNYAEARYNLGLALRQQGKLSEAESAFQQALRIKPDYGEARYQLGTTFHQQGKLDEAVECFRQLLWLRPDFAAAHISLGVVLATQDKLNDSLVCFQEAVRLQPEDPEAHNNLGMMVIRLKRPAEAEHHLRQALQLSPDFAEAHNNLGFAFIEQDKLEEAISCFHQALRIKPDYVEAHDNLGVALTKLGKPQEAMPCHQQALSLRPDFATAYFNRGITLRTLGNLPEALASFEQALELKPDYANAHLGRALTWLFMGDFEKGWPEYEWRWRANQGRIPRAFRQLLWDGSPLVGRPILLHAEQGLGDTLQFIRYAVLVKERGGRVIVECQPALAPILASCPGVDDLVARGSPLPDFEVHAPLLSLPGILKTTLRAMPTPPPRVPAKPDCDTGGVGMPPPAEIPYLWADANLVETWGRELSNFPEFKVGIVWQGDPRYSEDRHRSFPLNCLAPLARLDGVRIFSLQKGPGTEQLRNVDFPIIEFQSRLDEGSGAFMDTAAVMQNLNLVITSDTALAHLAGALAVPVWVALSFSPEWRWLRDREDSPWYPTMRLFRQRELGNWNPVFERMATEVAKLVATLTGKPGSGADIPVCLADRNVCPTGGLGRPISVPLSPGELIDKITILQIKSERIADPEKLPRVRSELAMLEKARAQGLVNSEELTKLTAELKAVNERLWQVEDDIRGCESAGDFGPRFTELARSVYRHNDARAALKSKINQLLHSPIAEQKEYSAYRAP